MQVIKENTYIYYRCGYIKVTGNIYIRIDLNNKRAVQNKIWINERSAICRPFLFRQKRLDLQGNTRLWITLAALMAASRAFDAVSAEPACFYFFLNCRCRSWLIGSVWRIFLFKAQRRRLVCRQVCGTCNNHGTKVPQREPQKYGGVFSV